MARQRRVRRDKRTCTATRPAWLSPTKACCKERAAAPELPGSVSVARAPPRCCCRHAHPAAHQHPSPAAAAITAAPSPHTAHQRERAICALLTAHPPTRPPMAHQRERVKGALLAQVPQEAHDEQHVDAQHLCVLRPPAPRPPPRLAGPIHATERNARMHPIEQLATCSSWLLRTLAALMKAGMKTSKPTPLARCVLQSHTRRGSTRRRLQQTGLGRPDARGALAAIAQGVHNAGPD